MWSSYCALCMFSLCLVNAKDEDYILLKDLKMETVSWSIPHVYCKTSEADISKGTLLFRKGNRIQVKGKEGAAFKHDSEQAIHVAPLDVEHHALLVAIPNPLGRFSVFVTDGWLDWGTAVKAGDSVYIRVPMRDGSECCSTARVHYIGKVTEDQPGTMFGVEITVS